MKKIKYKDAAYICRYKKEHPKEKYFCNWYIQKTSDSSGKMELYVKWWFYILTFIPVHILQAFWCMWDGGLREFSFEPRRIQSHNVIGFNGNPPNSMFNRLSEIWEKYNNEKALH